MEELHATLLFDDWLASVTERINQTMHYQFDGKPDPLVFHIPQKFFDCLQQRMSVGVNGRKKRLPNTSTSFVRRNSVPLGNFVKYTWRLTNVLHIKQIFDTPQRTLDITRRFVENHDGTYDLYELPRSSMILLPEDNSGKQPIRPAELKTFLKIGPVAGTGNPRDSIPFVIEWIPDILPLSHIGEMRIQFEFGHQCNGVIQQRPAAATDSATDDNSIQQIVALSTASA